MAQRRLAARADARAISRPGEGRGARAEGRGLRGEGRGGRGAPEGQLRDLVDGGAADASEERVEVLL